MQNCHKSAVLKVCRKLLRGHKLTSAIQMDSFRIECIGIKQYMICCGSAYKTEDIQFGLMHEKKQPKKYHWREILNEVSFHEYLCYGNDWVMKIYLFYAENVFILAVNNIPQIWSLNEYICGKQTKIYSNPLWCWRCSSIFVFFVVFK